jgi:hypothetical protein
MTERLHAAEHRAIRADHERAVAKVEAEKLRDELTRLRAEADGLREQVRALSRTVREAQTQERRTADLLATEKGRAARAAADAEAELRRIRARLLDAELTASGARAAAKESRTVDDVRLWLLLETIGQAAVGLRRELALEPATSLPADHVADAVADRPGAPGRTQARALEADDPARLDQLLALPRAHLIVDGYTSPSGASATCHWSSGPFLIAALTGTPPERGRDGVGSTERQAQRTRDPARLRVLFSRKGQTAD